MDRGAALRLLPAPSSLAARVLRLSAERAAGAHPYLVTPEHTRQARQILGDGPLLERYSILVGATSSKSPHADILRHGAQADRERHAK